MQTVKKLFLNRLLIISIHLISPIFGKLSNALQKIKMLQKNLAMLFKNLW